MAMGQEALKPKPSPLDMRTYKFEDGAYIKVVYSRPHKRGREIFGGLVPYDQLWRTGANQATEITITKPILVEGNELPAGTYSLFTIPQEDQWTIILNQELGMWGSMTYDESLDIMRIEVPVMHTEEVWEPFTIDFEQNNDHVDLVLIWDTTKVALKMEAIE